MRRRKCDKRKTDIHHYLSLRRKFFIVKYWIIAEIFTDPQITEGYLESTKGIRPYVPALELTANLKYLLT